MTLHDTGFTIHDRKDFFRGQPDPRCLPDHYAEVARSVGSAGQVTSIDLDQASIETAQRRGAAFGFENTSFHRADIAEYMPSSPFDAIIGRLVLQFVPDPIAIIKRLYGMLRPGGILALQEPTWKLWLTYTAHLPLRLAVTEAARDAFQAGGASTDGAATLPRLHCFRIARTAVACRVTARE